MDTLAPQDALDVFAELPHRVQVAVASHLHSLRSRGVVMFTDYDADVTAYIASSGLLNVRYGTSSVVFTANDATRALRENWRAVLELVGFTFA
jgi:hypothetical protein